jgi:GNAT superfamily N-acetyltransferase
LEHTRILGIAFESSEMADACAPTPEYAADPDLGVFVGYHNGRGVTAGQLLRVGPFATVAGVGTLPEFRGKGYGAALTMAALLEGRKRGCVAGALRSGPLSMPLYQRLGFQLVCRHRTYVPPPSVGNNSTSRGS